MHVTAPPLFGPDLWPYQDGSLLVDRGHGKCLAEGMGSSNQQGCDEDEEYRIHSRAGCRTYTYPGGSDHDPLMVAVGIHGLGGMRKVDIDHTLDKQYLQGIDLEWRVGGLMADGVLLEVPEKRHGLDWG